MPLHFSLIFGQWNADSYFMASLNSKISDSPSPPAGEQKRRSERVLLRIPIEVKGMDAGGKAFKEVTSTLVINHGGARISLKHSLKSNAGVTITNLQTQMSCPFRAVGHTSQTLGEGPECGVECLNKKLNFWGIKFPEKGPVEEAAAAKQYLVDALVECSVCHIRELAQLTMEQYRALSASSFLSRNCTQCGVPTEWKFGFVEPDRGEIPAALHVPKALASSAGEEQRYAKRLTARIPVRIRVPQGQGEITRTENLSKTGICFTSDQEMPVGEVISLTVGYEPGKNETEIAARVVWRRQQEGTSRMIYGVHLEDSV